MTLKVTINDKAYNAEEGEYILDLCRRNQILVPTLCHHESLSGLGACRLCVVEINEGRGNKVVVSCVYPLSKDCNIFTESEKIKGIRKTILSMLRARAPEGDRIASLCRIYGVEQESADEHFTVSKTKKGDTQNPAHLQRNHLSSSCVLCGLCVQACANLGAGAISTVGRGVEKKVSTPYDEPSADCVGCGSCAALCPTKAIECTEANGKRIIWDRNFTLLVCASCKKTFATEEEYAFAMKKAAQEKTAPEKAGEPDPTAPPLCETCRKKKSADVFAAAFGERA